ncbi:DUF2206 domain-containing protein [Methanothermobacter tenebrarum]|uniref:DUF2206 domain-containing protein n=1 Tax=Methanothermobacter tenebrarum TaxID=680118 RepID=UPI003D10052C
MLISGLKRSYKKLLFIISTVFSHYTIAYVFAILTFMFLKVHWKTKEELLFQSFSSCSVFCGYICMACPARGASFKDAITFFERTISSMGNFFSEDMRNNSELSVVGIGIAQIPNFLSTVIHDLFSS